MREEERDIGIRSYGDEIDGFDDALPIDEAMNGRVIAPRPIPKIKPLGQNLRQLAMNLVIGSILYLLCLAVAAHGLRRMVDVLQTNVHELPLPGVEKMAEYQGFSDLDLAHFASTLLFVAACITWSRLISEAKGYGTVVQERRKRPFVFVLYLTIALILIAVDALVFYAGLASQGGSWNETPWYVPVGCTMLYLAGIAGWEVFKHDFQYSDSV
ncbi:hypothetical protein U8335_13705 [Roseiconus lacunae]|uniref:hypothetical protein n=1 Tax=Roseiconus lacunae TaxID=2605694 RepID=UPI003090BFAC|nr:hypothetical protein U8335_13705 [Stieleria sp. HD01]